MTAVKFERVYATELAVGDVVRSEGYDWKITSIIFDVHGNSGTSPRYILRCKWNGTGANPRFFNDDMTLGQLVNLKWNKVVEWAK
jgi:hypothetical protein